MAQYPFGFRQIPMFRSNSHAESRGIRVRLTLDPDILDSLGVTLTCVLPACFPVSTSR